jgi:hypothetical protein
MQNKRGEIILALSKTGSLTTGVLLGHIEDAVPAKYVWGGDILPEQGICWTDWEVGGELEEYNGEITITFKNDDRSKN